MSDPRSVDRRRFLGTVAGGATATALAMPRGAVAQGKPRPNVVVLMGDDWSWPHAGALGDATVETPTFDRLAREGVLFESAFVSAPSCTPSRFAVASGQWHWRLGEGVNLGGSLAKDVEVYPDLLEAVGYAIGFSRKGATPSKRKYRERDPFGPKFKSFDEFIAQRAPGQPFCYWYGSGDPHRPYKWRSGVESGMAPGGVKVPGCLPDNETVRTDICDYYWEVQRFDRDAASILSRIEELGELDNTIVVMTGDNGMPFPRCKATLYDQGTRVPLAIRWGKGAKGGRVVRDFVSLCDLAPTFLEAAGLRRPKRMTGKSLMDALASGKSGTIDEERTFVLTGMERHSFAHPRRAIRTNTFLYILNFDPDGWPNGKADFDFSHNVDPSPTKTFIMEHRDDADTRPFHDMAFGRRPTEELYDLRKDPEQLRNVVDEPKYAGTRRNMSRQLKYQLRVSGDPRFPPEQESERYTTQEVAGWTVRVNDLLLGEEKELGSRVMTRLREKLEEIVRVVPDGAVARLRETVLWVELDNFARSGAEHHPSETWLRNNGRHPGKANCVEFGNAEGFLRETAGRQPMMVLHELAHAYHRNVLGWDHKGVVAAYKHADEAGLYDAVKNWAGKTVRAYAIKNKMEYFAETSEAWFGKNDFYPFNRDELKQHDPRMSGVLEKVWNRAAKDGS